ncbi:MAG: PQQ-dependent sugar dehydrogenase [Phycisphaerales bacterium]
MSMLRTFSLAALTVALATPALAQATLPIKTKRIVSGLAYPTRVVFAPGDDTHMYIVQKAGKIVIFDLSTNTLQATPFLDIDPIVVGGASVSDEQGLLGLAFHPDWPNTPYFYVYYTSVAGSGDDTLARYTALSATAADPASAYPIKSWDDPFTNHNGGCLRFGTDGYLYLSVGDGGSANDPGNRAQTIVNMPLGKMLRIDINGDDFPADPTKNYAIVPTNPFVGTVGDDEILFYGLRNPWCWSFDRLTNDYWIGDVGQNAWEEIDFAPAGSSGLNFGWRCTEGSTCTGLTGCTCNGPTLTAPVHVYDHGATGGNSVTGGVVYRGCEIPEAQGVYFFGDYGSGRFWSFKYVNGVKTLFTVQTTKFTPSIDVPPQTLNQQVYFAEDNHGEVYIVDHGGATSGQVFRMVRDPAAAPLPDCDGDGISDLCAITNGAADCNGNGVPDSCDIAADPAQDCDGNGQLDACEIAGGTAQDCNGNGKPDSCDIASGFAQDCNANGKPDSCDIADGSSMDANANGVPDECEPSLPGDLNGDGHVDGADLGLMLGVWGECTGTPCAGDLNGDGVVDGADLGSLLGAWTG